MTLTCPSLVTTFCYQQYTSCMAHDSVKNTLSLAVTPLGSVPSVCLAFMLLLLIPWWRVSDSSPWRLLITLGSLCPWGSSLGLCTQRVPVEPVISPRWPGIGGARPYPSATSLVPPPPLGGGAGVARVRTLSGSGQFPKDQRKESIPTRQADMKALEGPPCQKRSAPGSRLEPQEASPKPTPSCRASGSMPDELSLQLNGWMQGKSRTMGGETC